MQVQTRLDQQQQRLRDDPDLRKSFALPDVNASTSSSPRTETKTVSFSPQVAEYDPSPLWDLDDLHAMWWTAEDIYGFNKAAIRRVKNFLRHHEKFTETFMAVFQDCSKDMNTRQLWESDNVTALLDFPTELRGLESRAISIVRQYRKFHIQSVLEVDHRKEAVLRARSLSTSKPSRAIARILARQDSMSIASMIRTELESEGSSPGTSSSSLDTTSIDRLGYPSACPKAEQYNS
eukprot:CAMPEP_0178825664 /NCGR_PEP_ID=MMETSP0746-20121128/6346_1 /TAXON_ID=913974 /ORGANISM="Nitzschia punctata, Strain CCMP561" /LENGTH=234 /DNA_ID=CAMNT_0020487451 /DNA_START=93 /DNA_END=797 /DNA_ORIENTATION=+